MSDEHDSHHVNYFLIFGFLCVCTALSVVFDLLSLSNKYVLVVLVLGVAVAKALFVMLFFMHLKFEGNWKFVLLAPTIILAMGIPLALLPDIGVHYYVSAAPQETAIRDALRDIVAGEDKADPKSDDQLAEELKQHYYYRLTPGKIAHFRDSMDIPAQEDRKRDL